MRDGCADIESVLAAEMTLEEFKKEYFEVAPREYGLFEKEVELFISCDGCMEVIYGGEAIPHLADEDWGKVLDGAMKYIRTQVKNT